LRIWGVKTQILCVTSGRRGFVMEILSEGWV